MFWAQLFGVTRGGGVTKENSYSPACLITGWFFLRSAMWYRDVWLLFSPWSYSLVFLLSWF